MKSPISTSAVFTSAALAIALQVAIAPRGNAPICLKTMNGQLNCIYGSITQCEQAPGSSAGQCMTRSDAGGTTGLGDRPVEPPRLPQRE
jgi:hypothetical protein